MRLKNLNAFGWSQQISLLSVLIDVTRLIGCELRQRTLRLESFWQLFGTWLALWFLLKSLVCCFSNVLSLC